MSLKAGRVGVNPADVDPIDGHISPSSVDSYTKAQADAKFETLEAAAALQPKTLAVPIEMLQGSLLVPKTTVEDVIQTMDNAMTNRELTESVQGDSDVLTLSFSESSNVTLRIRKLIDDIVVISAYAGGSYSGLSTSWVTVENFIPIKYRPSLPVYTDMHIGPNAYLRFNILSDGTLKYLCTSNSTVYIQGTTMYVRS